MAKTNTATEALGKADYRFECGMHIYNAVLFTLEDDGEGPEDAACWASYRLECALKRLPPEFAERLYHALEADMEHGDLQA